MSAQYILHRTLQFVSFCLFQNVNQITFIRCSTSPSAGFPTHSAESPSLPQPFHSWPTHSVTSAPSIKPSGLHTFLKFPASSSLGPCMCCSFFHPRTYVAHVLQLSIQISSPHGCLSSTLDSNFALIFPPTSYQLTQIISFGSPIIVSLHQHMSLFMASITECRNN